MATPQLFSVEIWHKDFNLEEIDNLKTLPQQSAVFGIFALLDNQPMNCRYVGETGNLYQSIKELFENPLENGLKYFMQGPWIKMVQYLLMPDSTQQQREVVVEDWEEKYHPKIDESGEYPGYYQY